MGPVYGGVCTLTPQLSSELTAPTHEATAWLCLPEWLHAQIVLPARKRVTHPSTNRARREATTLIETNTANPPFRVEITEINNLNSDNSYQYNDE